MARGSFCIRKVPGSISQGCKCRLQVKGAGIIKLGGNALTSKMSLQLIAFENPDNIWVVNVGAFALARNSDELLQPILSDEGFVEFRISAASRCPFGKVSKLYSKNRSLQCIQTAV